MVHVKTIHNNQSVMIFSTRSMEMDGFFDPEFYQFYSGKGYFGPVFSTYVIIPKAKLADFLACLNFHCKDREFKDLVMKVLRNFLDQDEK